MILHPHLKALNDQDQGRTGAYQRDDRLTRLQTTLHSTLSLALP